MSADNIELTPVFRLKPNRLYAEDNTMATSQIKFVDYITPSQKLGDEPVNLNVSDKVKKYIMHIQIILVILINMILQYLHIETI